MAHMKVVVFSKTQRDADKLIKHFCRSLIDDRVLCHEKTVRASHEPVFYQITRWDDYRIWNGPLPNNIGKCINAFITAEGELVEDSELAWRGLEFKMSEGISLFLALFINYERIAQQKSLKMFLVDCHI